MAEENPQFKILPDEEGNMPKGGIVIMPDAKGNTPESAKPFKFMPKPKAAGSSEDAASNTADKQPTEQPSPQTTENPRLRKALTEMVYSFLKAEKPENADSKQRWELVNAVVNVIEPVVVANSHDEPRIIATKITKTIFLPERSERKDTDATLVAWELREANKGYSDDTIANGKFVFKGLIDKLIPGIEEHRVVIYNARNNKISPDREFTPFEKAYKEMIVGVIAEGAGIRPGTEQSERIANNFVILTAPILKNDPSMLENPKKAAKKLTGKLLEQEGGKEKLDTIEGMLAYDLRIQAKKKAGSGGMFVADMMIESKMKDLIEEKVKGVEAGNLIALLKKESAVAQKSNEMPYDLKSLPPGILNQSFSDNMGVSGATPVPYEPVRPLGQKIQGRPSSKAIQI